MPRLTPDRRKVILDLIREGKTVPEIHALTGEAKRTIAYHAAANGLTVASRYCRVSPGNYWRSLRGNFWRSLTH